MNISKVLLTTFSKDINKFIKPSGKSSCFAFRTIFTFATNANKILDSKKIFNYLPNVKSIKVWSL